MKTKIFLCFLLFLTMLLLPLVSLGTFIPDKTAPAPKIDITIPHTAASGSSFQILDQTSGKVLTVDDKSFLYGTVATEMSPESQPEALKAQAVAAYTYYSRVRQQERSKPKEKQKGSDFSATTGNWLIYVSKEQMQERWGAKFTDYYKKLTTSVNSVFGQVLKSEGTLIDATYYAISSGKTEDSQDVWGGKCSYLVPVASPGDIFAGGYQTTASLSESNFKTAVLKAAPKANLSGNASTWVGAITRTGSGTVKTISIGGESMTGNTARSAFGLRSANFTVSYANGTFSFLVKGYGHGVGMSQVGAQYMAGQGSDYKTILAWYYPSTSLSSMDSNTIKATA